MRIDQTHANDADELMRVVEHLAHRAFGVISYVYLLMEYAWFTYWLMCRWFIFGAVERFLEKIMRAQWLC